MRNSRYSKAERSLKLNGDLSAVANVGGVIGRFFTRARCLIVALILLSLLLAACGGGTGSDTSPDTSQSSVAASASESTEQTSGSGPPNSQVSETPAAQSVSPSATASSPTATSAPSETAGNLSALYQEEIDELIAATERVRGLEFLTPPKVVLLSPEDFRERAVSGLDENLEDIDSEDAMYKLLGLLEPETSLREIYHTMFSGATTGYYDSEKKELVVPITESGMDIETRLTLVHELVHALTDQHFDFHKTSEELADNDQTDQYFALSAVIEGDAVEAETRYYSEELTDEEKAELAAANSAGQSAPGTPGSIPPAQAIIQGEIDRQLPPATPGSSDSPDTARIPEFLGSSFQFSYTHGSSFLRSLVGREPMNLDVVLNDEDFRAINELYAKIPASTEQIYFAEKYRSEEPLEVNHRVAELPGYELVETNTWGSLTFAAMFDQVLGFNVPDQSAMEDLIGEDGLPNPAFILQASPRRKAVDGWGGDRYSLWYNGSEVAMAMTYRGDEASDAEELAETMREYISTAMNVGEPEISGELETSGGAETSSNAAESGDTAASGYSVTWNGEDFAWLKVAGDTVRFVAASDPAVGAELAAFYEAV